MTAAVAKKHEPAYTRRVSTRKEKVDTVTYIQNSCQKGTSVTDSQIFKKFHVARAVHLMLKKKYIRAGAEPKTYVWNTNLDVDHIVDKLWTLHGHTKPAEKVTISKVYEMEPLKQEDYAIDEDLVTKYGGKLPVKEEPQQALYAFIDECIGDCAEYDIVEKGKYIAAKLMKAGYLK